jgi:hypothetical protein
MVVLATGFRVSEEVRHRRHDRHRTQYPQLCQTSSFDPVATSKPGIYVCGVIEGPKDIPETMVQASAAACRGVQHTPASAAMEDRRRIYPPERDVSGETRASACLFCDCGENIGGAIDVTAVRPGGQVSQCGAGRSGRAMAAARKPWPASSSESSEEHQPGGDRRLLAAHPRRLVSGDHARRRA